MLAPSPPALTESSAMRSTYRPPSGYPVVPGLPPTPFYPRWGVPTMTTARSPAAAPDAWTPRSAGRSAPAPTCPVAKPIPTPPPTGSAVPLPPPPLTQTIDPAAETPHPAISSTPADTPRRRPSHRRRSSASSLPPLPTSTPLFVHANGSPMRLHVDASLPRKIGRAIERYGGAVVPREDALVHVVPHPPGSQAADIDPDALVVSVRWVYGVVKKRAMVDLRGFAVEYVPDWAVWAGHEACTAEVGA
ncbi:hypothetical protein Q8F55_008546 [Vanrija albida]|uniref:BRCT domain-containing protein n=1 Tax=Vanrija albida TaxID=181172 RepID=A0ABR3PR52_9TREE